MWAAREGFLIKSFVNVISARRVASLVVYGARIVGCQEAFYSPRAMHLIESFGRVRVG
jgi:hypothetical protein